MPRWLLTAAGNRRERGGPPLAQPYAVRCLCGRVLRGRRAAEWQEPVCDRCGESVFILPRDIYPKVSLPREPARAAAGAGRTGLANVRARGVELAGRMRTVPGVAASAVYYWVERGRRRVTRLHLIVFTMLALSLTTVWLVWSAQAREQAQLTLRRSVERGEAALAEQDLAVASVEFRQAAEALDVLRRHDRPALRLRQLDRECQAATNLATASIPDMLEEAQRARANNPAADWQDRFQTAYGGRWIVLDTTVSRVPADGTGPSFRVEYPLSVGGLPVVIEADLPAFRRLSWDSDSRPVIFAAPAVDCRLAAGKPRRWIIRLDGESGFLWCHYETLEGLGFGADEFRSEEAIRELLAEQAGRAGLEKVEVH